MNWIIAGLMICTGAQLASSLAVSHLLLPAQPMEYGAWLLRGLILVGVWKVTSPDPAVGSAESILSARKLLRFASTISFIGRLFLLLIQSQADGLVAGTEALLTINGILFFFVLLIYARAMALRIPDDTLASSCRKLMWGFVSLTIITMLATVILLFRSTGRASSPVGAPASDGWEVKFQLGRKVLASHTEREPLFGAAVCGLVIWLCILSVWSLILTLRFRKEFARAARSAKLSWESPLARPLSTQAT